jgi:hypothetical protein
VNRSRAPSVEPGLVVEEPHDHGLTLDHARQKRRRRLRADEWIGRSVDARVAVGDVSSELRDDLGVPVRAVRRLEARDERWQKVVPTIGEQRLVRVEAIDHVPQAEERQQPVIEIRRFHVLVERIVVPHQRRQRRRRRLMRARCRRERQRRLHHRSVIGRLR